jgi:hypothetical protein
VAVKIAQRAKDFSSKFPTISISKTHLSASRSPRRAGGGGDGARSRAQPLGGLALRVVEVVPDDDGASARSALLRDDGSTRARCTRASASSCSPTKARATT